MEQLRARIAAYLAYYGLDETQLADAVERTLDHLRTTEDDDWTAAAAAVVSEPSGVRDLLPSPWPRRVIPQQLEIPWTDAVAQPSRRRARPSILVAPVPRRSTSGG